jgi:hypothetical protein
MAADTRTKRADVDGRPTMGARAEALARTCLALVALLAGPLVCACVSSSSNVGPAAGSDRDAAVADSGPRGDASLADAAPGSDGGDPFEGVWEGVQLGATVEIANAAGCALFKSTVGGTVCDECTGNYVAGDGGSASVVAKCVQRGACSVSPPHTDTGTFTLTDGGALSFVYDYGGGTASFEGQRTQRSAGDVCDLVDAGAGD